jgi:hypothetical protein
MKYMLLVYGNESEGNGSDWEACYRESAGLARELRERGQHLGGTALQPTTTATSVRVRDGKRLVTDGPFAETREQLGGYYLIEAQDLDEAIQIAGRVPGARWGTVEVRPVLELRGLPAAPADQLTTCTCKHHERLQSAHHAGKEAGSGRHRDHD